MKYAYAIVAIALAVVSIGFPDLLMGIKADDSVKTIIGLMMAMIIYGRYQILELNERLKNATAN